MKKFIIFISLVAAFFQISAVYAGANYANKERGWHKGVYILVGTGFMNVDKDTNVNTNVKFGEDLILGYGMIVGWNFLDPLAVELQMRYGTEKEGIQREHAANISGNFKYSFILDALTRAVNFRLLPYLKAGGGYFGAGVPRGGNDRLAVHGPSIVLGGGLEALIHEHFYIGIDFTEDIAFLQEHFVNGVKILNGGVDPQHSLFGYLGWHF